MWLLRRTLKNHSFYIIAFFIAIIPMLLVVFLDSKVDGFIKLNILHDKWLDYFFIVCTTLGDGLVSLLVAGIVWWWGRNATFSLHIIIAFLLSGAAALVLKKVFLEPRPRVMIPAGFYNHFLDGITVTGWDSFPSGHTTSVFALATIMALHVQKKAWTMFFLFVAMLVGYSRIYLGNHFPLDVMAGAFLGMITGVLVYTTMNFRGRLPHKIFSSEGDPKENDFYSTFIGN